jgi:uncharacterized membrane protein
MRVAMHRIWKGLLAGGAVAGSPEVARACAVCYGDPGAPAAKGLAWAVVALVLVVAAVLSGVVAFFVHAVRQESRQEIAENGRRAEERL